MACSCSSKNKGYIVTAADGKQTEKATELEAMALVKRVGGSYRKK